MPDVKTQIMLVSAQAAPNLLAAADADLKPDRAALVVSASMRPRADALGRVLAESGVAVQQCHLRDEHDPKAIEDNLLQWFEDLPSEGTYLNLTGGTKLMALTAFAVAEAARWRSFYVDVDTDHVVWLGGAAASVQKLKERIGLRHYLGAYGIDIDGDILRGDASKAQQAFVEELLLYYEDYFHALPHLNRAMDRAERQRSLTVELTDDERDSKALGRLLDFAERRDMVSIEAARLHVSDEATRDFLKGGWLERHVFATVTQLQGSLGIRDRALNLKVRQAGVVNELDVAFLLRNRLHVVECKTRNVGADNGERAHEALFKLAENSRRLGGLATRGMLVSYRELRDAELRLARLLQIEVVHGREVPRLRERIRAWCGGR